MHQILKSHTILCLAHVFCPQPIRNVWTFRHIDSSSIIAQPVNFDILRERLLKLNAENSIYIGIIDANNAISDMDFLY